MKVKINGKEEDLREGIDLQTLLREKGIKLREVGLAVALNGQVIPKSQYSKTKLKEGDEVEIVHIVGGG